MSAALEIHQIVSSRFFDADTHQESGGGGYVTSSHVSTNSNSGRSGSDGGSSSSSSSVSTVVSNDGESSTTVSTVLVVTDDGTVRIRHIDGSSSDDEITVRTESGTHSVIRGGDGDDVVIMGAGNDLIDGGPGDDELTGGDGEDVFRVEQDTGTDVIVDFTHGADRIDVRAFEITSIAELTIDGGTIEFDDGSTLVVLNTDLLTQEDLIF